ncbi:hypothetical protein QFC19_008592 [Naganishia cerealis]|uniref:Uncharacterized protein n=1 Tax=Naganishia cerealis TaxID=610337 RepID=A0ACC2V1A8_9TREE|nr:hypothetical protein QFC19_008592 [Naganishia cerealis]
MASNPPIAGLQSTGSLDLHTRINRFLTTLEPHLHYFTSRGRSHLDSLLERDKAEHRRLNIDKTGWAAVPIGGTSLVDARGDGGEDGKRSEVSVTAMSSVSQRGGRVSRMRDRNGNTAADIHVAGKQRKLRVVSGKTGGPMAPFPDTSSSPIQPWKDIRPQSPSNLPPNAPPTPELITRTLYGEDNHTEEPSVTLAKELVDNDVYDKSSRKRKSHINGCGSDVKRRNGINKSARQSNNHNVTRHEQITDTGEKPNPAVSPAMPDQKSKKPHQNRASLVEAASKLNCEVPIQERENGDARTGTKTVEKTSKKKLVNDTGAERTAEEQSREERSDRVSPLDLVLSVRRTKRRAKMSFKTANVPVSKQTGTRAAEQGKDEKCSIDDDADQIKATSSRGVQANRTVTSLGKRGKDPGRDIGTALLQAYDSSGHLDRSHRITLPKTSLRLGIFGKGMSSRQGGTAKASKHPPDLQFQTESFVKRKKRLSISTCSSASAELNDGDTSLASDSQVHERVDAPHANPCKTRKQARGKENCNSKITSEIHRTHRIRTVKKSEKKEIKHTMSKKAKQPSPDWPSVLHSSDGSEAVDDMEKMNTSDLPVHAVGSKKKLAASKFDHELDFKQGCPQHSSSPISKPARDSTMIIAQTMPSGSEHSARMSAVRGRMDLSSRAASEPVAPVSVTFGAAQTANIEQTIQENCYSSRSPSLGDQSYESIMANALAEASSPSIIVQASPVPAPLVPAHTMFQTDDGHVREYVSENLDHAYPEFEQMWQAKEMEDYSYEQKQVEHNPMGFDAFNQEISNDSAEVTYQVFPQVVCFQSERVDQDAQHPSSGGKVVGLRSVNQFDHVHQHEQLDIDDSVSSYMRIDPEETFIVGFPKQIDDTLDVFGTDAEQVRRALYGTRFHR